ncbi:hypothetical protein CALCODRAFT_511582 [Calocera cornea HHB12733]|uniref:Uncharacterized protein n=1 Tax=Calocera cornea HHB12733 TaxID=1353952 RepID=A0A165DP38_9BASI|nr:hypothetical protein CALCODRAFT_511582 [Calocera cornea HHB12733]
MGVRVPTFVFIFLLPKGLALLQLLREVNSELERRPGGDAFRAAVYYWIRQAYGNGETSCRMSVLSASMEPLIETDLLSPIVAAFGTVLRYFQKASSRGIVKITKLSRRDVSINLEPPFSMFWDNFKAVDIQGGLTWLRKRSSFIWRRYWAFRADNFSLKPKMRD